MTDTTLSVDDARQQFHDIIRKDVPFDDKARDALELATQCLGVDNGHLARIDQETDYWKAAVTTDTPDGQTPPDLERDLQETYCRDTIENDIPLTLHDAPDQGWADDPAFETREFHTYLGVPLIVDDEPYGTVCFVAEEPRPEPFNDTETRFAEHLTRLLEREFEREQVEAKLTTQTNFATVLNRVLRHNLRNDISVIRGRTEFIAEQLDDDSTVETVLSHIDDLIELSQKARDLEEVITASSERRHTEIGAFIEEIVEPIEKEYPAASISVEYDDKIHVNVLQNFDRAVEELIENAIKHSGDRPTVSVAVDRVPNAVEIQISDDGPGLPDNEVEVLERGAETPLTHGSGVGLWMAHWIVTSHDGSIDPVVTENGTTLTITVPRKTAVGVHQQFTELTRSRDKYNATFEKAHDAMVIADDDGRYIEANEKASELFGLSEAGLLGRTIAEFAPDDFDFEEEWQQFQGGDDARGVFPLRRPDGSERVVEYSATSDIVPGEHLSVLRDITERQERERELTALKERYETLLEAAPDPVFVADPETGEIIRTNAAGETLLGKSKDEIVGKHQSAIHPSDQSEQYQQLFEEHIQTRGTRRQLPDGSPIHIVTDEGEQVPVEISVDTVSLPDGPITFGIFRKTSDQVERERER